MTLPIDVTRLRCDFLSATARKFLRGPRGLGFLYVSDRVLQRGEAPLFIDMRGANRRQPTRKISRWMPAASKTGSSPTPSFSASAPWYALDAGVEECSERALMLADKLRDTITISRGCRSREKRGAIVTADFGRDASEIVAAPASGTSIPLRRSARGQPST
jgi:selenocysteine lyase/cysteine desulfurase